MNRVNAVQHNVTRRDVTFSPRSIFFGVFRFQDKISERITPTMTSAKFMPPVKRSVYPKRIISEFDTVSQVDQIPKAAAPIIKFVRGIRVMTVKVVPFYQPMFKFLFSANWV